MIESSRKLTYEYFASNILEKPFELINHVENIAIKVFFRKFPATRSEHPNKNITLRTKHRILKSVAYCQYSQIYLYFYSKY